MKNFNNYDEILKYLVDDFSSDNFFSSEYRKILEEKFSKKLTVLDFIDRKSVSFQLSKKAKVHNWIKSNIIRVRKFKDTLQLQKLLRIHSNHRWSLP